MVYWAVELEETVNSIMTFTSCRWDANAENGIRMTVLRVSDDKNLMIFVPLSGFDIAGALLLKYRILLYFSFLENYYWYKNSLSLKSQFKKNEHVFLLLVSSYIFLFILSILLLISYMIYILYIRRDIRKTWLRFYNWDWDLRLHMITRFSISSLQGKRLQGAPQQLLESNVFYVAVKSRKRQR